MAKRDREHNIQGWFDPENAEENAVIQAFAFLREKFPAMMPKWVLGNALLFAAQSEGFEPEANPSIGFDGRVDDLLTKIDRLTFLLESGGAFQMGEAARMTYDDEATVQLDAISASVGSGYRRLQFEDEE